MVEIVHTITYLVFAENTKYNWIGKTIKRSHLGYEVFFIWMKYCEIMNGYFHICHLFCAQTI